MTRSTRITARLALGLGIGLAVLSIQPVDAHAAQKCARQCFPVIVCPAGKTILDGVCTTRLECRVFCRDTGSGGGKVAQSPMRR